MTRAATDAGMLTVLVVGHDDAGGPGEVSRPGEG